MHIEKLKPHIARLPIRDFPDLNHEYTSPITVSIPMFMSNTDSGHKPFNVERFQQVHVRGAIYTAITLCENTDFIERGTQIMFHVEDSVYDYAIDVFRQFNVPEHLIHKRTIDTPNLKLGQPQFGKKFMCLFEDCPSDAWMLIDTDIQFCTTQNKALIYDKLVDAIDRDWVCTTFLCNYDDYNRKEYGRGICYGAGKQWDPDGDFYEQICSGFEDMGLPHPPNNSYFPYPCTQIFLSKHDSSVCDFMRRNVLRSCQDEFTLSAWMVDKSRHTQQEADWGIGHLVNYLGLPFYNFETDYLNRDVSTLTNGYITHIHPDGHLGDLDRIDEFYNDFEADVNRHKHQEEITMNAHWTDVSTALANSTSDKEGDRNIDHHYGLYYNLILNALYAKMGRKLNVLEIGVSLFGSGSFRAFADLDIVDCIVGVDIKNYEAEKTSKMAFIQKNAYDENTPQWLLETFDDFDLIIEDGTHNRDDQLFVAKHYADLIAPGGVMVIEDIVDREAGADLAVTYGFNIIDGWMNSNPDNPDGPEYERFGIKMFDDSTSLATPVIPDTPTDTSISNQLTLHVLCPPYAIIGDDCYTCAFAEKARKFVGMMAKLGCKCYLYAAEGSECEGAYEIIEVVDRGLIDKTYQGWQHTSDCATSYKTGDIVSQKFDDAAEIALRGRVKKNDIVCAGYGWGHKGLCDRIENHCKHVGAFVVEPFIGYPTCFQKNRIYESGYKQAFDRGRRGVYAEDHYEYFHEHSIDLDSTVIGNFFDPADFVCDEPLRDEDHEPYALFVGRLISTKGVWEAIFATQEAGIKLYLAGQDHDNVVKDLPPHCRYLGIIDPKQRAYYMKYADATICYSHYSEPWCGVHTESLLCGTPVITSNHGVFHETVIPGYNGYRCQMPADIITALNNVHKINSQDCIDSGMNNCCDLISIRFYYALQSFLRLWNHVEPNKWHTDNWMPDLDWTMPYDKERVQLMKTRIINSINEELIS